VTRVPIVVRVAERRDIAAMHVVRLAVRENRLVSAVIGPADYERELEITGRGWVAEVDGVIAGFAVGNARTGNIWALFVAPEHERRGLGRALHDVMVAWLFESGLERLHLTTAPDTRAFGFYVKAGWTPVDAVVRGEQRFELAASERRRASELR
jgi:GNAT superfamily N-acetyltransferase